MHKYREWGGAKFGSKPKWNNWEGRYEPVEPCLEACGDCGKPREEHVDQMSHQEQITLLHKIRDEALANAKKTQELLDWFICEMRKNGRGS